MSERSDVTRGWRRVAITAALTLVSTALIGTIAPSPASATHFRANQVSWHSTGTPNEAEFHLTGSWRLSYFFDPASPPVVGDEFEPAQLEFGDDTYDIGPWEVTAVDVNNDVVSGERHTAHTYASPGPWTAAINSCCRLSAPQHINNPDGDLRVESIVDLAATSASPVSLVSPIVDCAPNAVCSFVVPAIDADNQLMRWRFATPEESGWLVQPGAPHAPHNATIDAITGRYSWNTSGVELNTSGSGDTFYSTQVVVENVVGGAVVAKTPVDFFIRLTTTANAQPTFQAPTPGDGSTITASPGSPVTFDVSAVDPDAGDVVTLSMLNKPADATFTTLVGNPASGSFSWTPTAVGDTIITLNAQDQHGLGALQRSVIIRTQGAPKQPTSTTANAALLTLAGPAVYLKLSAVLRAASADPTTGESLQGKTVGFYDLAGTQLCSGVTDGTGLASCKIGVGLIKTVTGNGYRATFSGDQTYAASTSTAKLFKP